MPPPEPDFQALIPNVPHWLIVRIKRGSNVLIQLVGEATRQHKTMSVMGCRPGVVDVAVVGPSGAATSASNEAIDSSERASTRCAVLDSCVNSVVEGFLV